MGLWWKTIDHTYADQVVNSAQVEKPFASLRLGHYSGYSFTDGVQRGLCAVGEMEFIEDAAHIFGNGPLVHDKGACNFLIAQTACDQTQGFHLAAGEMFIEGNAVTCHRALEILNYL